MIKQGAIISIDYTNTYCQVCFYSMRHNRPESVTTDSEVMRYLIPTALTYDKEHAAWLIGNTALENAQLTRGELYTDFLERAEEGRQVVLGDKTFTYLELFAIYLGKMVEMAKTATATRKIYNLTVNVRRIDLRIKEVFTEAFELIGIEADRLKFLCCPESFAYYILNEDTRLWATGALLFDFSEDGFYIRLLKIAGEKGKELVFVEETDCNEDFSIGNLASEMIRKQLDEKLNDIFEDIYADNPVASVFFAGSGFNELWFEQTLENISGKIRAFKGNNLYVKGACLSGYRRMSDQKDLPIICGERTKARIHFEARKGSDVKYVTLSQPAESWHDAGGSVDLIPDNASWMTFKITSALRDRTETLDFDLEEFPKRPNKATRIEVGVRYLDADTCEIFVRDKGFGGFFESSGKVLVKQIALKDYL